VGNIIRHSPEENIFNQTFCKKLKVNKNAMSDGLDGTGTLEHSC
jgi:hypothetical protein